MTAEVAPASTASDGRWRIAFVALADDPTSVADIDAGDLLTYSFTEGGFVPSSTQSEAEDKRLTRRVNTTRPGREKETLETKYVESTAVDSANAVLTRDTEGYFVVRRGVDNATEWTIGDKVDIYTVQCGAQRPDAPVENGVDTVSQTQYITAPTRRRVTLVA